MIRKACFLAVVFSMLFCGSSFALSLDPIPDKTDILVFINNHSNLPLVSFLEKAPIPPPAKEKIESFFNETSFNPLRDISQVQIMVKKAEQEKDDEQVFVLTGKFNKEKISEFLKKINIFNVEQSAENELFKSKDGKGALCIFSNEKAAVGKLAMFQAFLDAKSGKAQSNAFDSVKGLLNDKSYATLLIGNTDFLNKEMEKNRKKRLENVGEKPMKKWFEGYLFDGISPQGVFVQVFESKIEAKLLYDRGSQNKNSINASIEINDPKVGIKIIFNEILKNFPMK